MDLLYITKVENTENNGNKNSEGGCWRLEPVQVVWET